MKRGRHAPVLLALAAAAAAQEDLLPPHDLRERGEVALRQAVLDAANDRLALLVASHPDDQYLHPATLLRFGYGWRVAVVLFTRGEGGQNISGSETGDALAARRTEETRRCAARLGIDVHHLDRPDSGYCRTAEEALDAWGRLGTSNDLAKLIRRLRPDLVWTTHHPAETHGHDLGLLELLPDALERAASPLHRWEGLPPFQVPVALRACSPEEKPDLELPGDGIDPVRGEAYRELAYRALAEHRSQAPFRDMDEIYPVVLRLRALVDRGGLDRVFSARGDLFAELENTLGTRADLDSLRTTLESELPARTADRRALLRLALDARRRLMQLEPGTAGSSIRVQRRVAALDAVIVHASTISARTSTPSGSLAVEGSPASVLLRVTNGDVTSVDSLRVRSDDRIVLQPNGAIELGRLEPGTSVERVLACRFGSLPTRLPVIPAPPGRLWLELEFGDQRVSWPVIVALDARPALECAAIRPTLLWPRGRRTSLVAVRVSNHREQDVRGVLSTRTPVGWSLEPASATVEVVGGSTHIFTFTLTAPEDLKPGVQTLRVRFRDVVTEFAVHSIDLVAPRPCAVGLIPGVDDTSRRVLEDLGVELHVLDGDDVATFPLDTLQSLVVDMRALSVQPTARAAFARLLQFVADGGRLVVLYHKDKEWEAPGFRGSPYPLRIGRGRVTQEDAPVRVLREDHVLLRWPNRVLASDWDGWVQERGLYFAEDYDPRFEEVLAMSDVGQPELRGGLLYATHGAGDYVYCALALFRQLKALHPGASRLFANLVSPPPASSGR